MYILVTGIAGWIGSAFRQHCQAEGHTVVGIDKVQPIRRGDWIREDLALVQPDFQSNLDDELSSEQFDLIVNLAGEIRVPQSAENPGLYYRNNVVTAANVFLKARQYGVPVVHISSSTAAFPESSHYAATKAATETAMRIECDLGADIRTVRIHNIYGPGQPDDYLIPRLFNCILSGETFKLSNGGLVEKDYIYVDDVVRAILAAAQLPAGTTSDIATGTMHSVRDIMLTACRVSGRSYMPHVDVIDHTRRGEPSVTANLRPWKDIWQAETKLWEGMLRVWETMQPQF